ncbi:hypothetical protein ACFORL_00175 [Legionella dresdenensis]|uniref:Uncharacterized protein n=1 Tax=Legionella dresdenensis TaxID=450200 RepID=A0ABV8CC36_9GAMM
MRNYPNQPKFKEWIDYSIDLQPIISSYLIPHPKVAPRLLLGLIQAQRSVKESLPEFAEYLDHIKKTISDYDSDGNFFSRVLLPLNLGGHFGYAVIDLKNKQAVIGEPYGSIGYEASLKDYEKLIREAFPDVNVQSHHVRYQTDVYNCGRISAKMLAYLGTSQKSIHEALLDRREMEKFIVKNEQESYALYQEQCELVINWKNQYTNPLTIYGPLLEKMGLGKPNNSSIYAFLRNTFFSVHNSPFILVDIINVYEAADQSTKEEFKALIENYLIAENHGSLDSNQQIFEQEFVNLIPKLAFNYCNELADTANQTPVKPETDNHDEPVNKDNLLKKLAPMIPETFIEPASVKNLSAMAVLFRKIRGDRIFMEQPLDFTDSQLNSLSQDSRLRPLLIKYHEFIPAELLKIFQKNLMNELKSFIPDTQPKVETYLPPALRMWHALNGSVTWQYEKMKFTESDIIAFSTQPLKDVLEKYPPSILPTQFLTIKLMSNLAQLTADDKTDVANSPIKKLVRLLRGDQELSNGQPLIMTSEDWDAIYNNQKLKTILANYPKAILENLPQAPQNQAMLGR